MYYFITILREGTTYYVVSPKFGQFALSTTRETNTYLWSAQENAEKDGRWVHLLQHDDVVSYNRTYRC